MTGITSRVLWVLQAMGFKMATPLQWKVIQPTLIEIDPIGGRYHGVAREGRIREHPGALRVFVVIGMISTDIERLPRTLVPDHFLYPHPLTVTEMYPQTGPTIGSATPARPHLKEGPWFKQRLQGRAVGRRPTELPIDCHLGISLNLFHVLIPGNTCLSLPEDAVAYPTRPE